MFDKLHFYPKYFIFFTAILLLFALPAFADSTKSKTKKTKQSKDKSLRVPEPKEYKRVYQIWKQYYLALEKGENPSKPIPTGYNFTSDKEADKISSIWNMASYDAYRYLSLKKDQQTQQTQQHKSLKIFNAQVAYKIWSEYYQTQEKGENLYPPNFEPLNASEQEAKKLMAIWNKGKQKAEKEALKRREDARTGKTSFQAQTVTPLPGSNQILASQTNNLHLNTPNHLKHFSKPTTIAGVFSQTTNSAYTDSVKLLNNNNSITLNNNKALAELNAQNISYNVAKAKELANIAYPLVDNPGVTTQYLIDPNNITGLPQVVEELQNGQVIRQYTYGADGIISMRQRINNEWVVSFFIKDGHGSVRMLTDVNGNITDTYDYDAFGNLVAKTGNTPNSRLYAGEEFDEDLGFYYLRARFLDTVKGRFHTQDEFEGFITEPTSLNKYIYGEANPVNNIDPSGLTSIATIANFSTFKQLILSSPTLQTPYFTSQGATNAQGKPIRTFQGQLCDITLSSIFGGFAAANGFEPAQVSVAPGIPKGGYTSHLDPNKDKIMHIYGTIDGTGISDLYLPPGGIYKKKHSDSTATHFFYYPTLLGKTNITISVSHIQNFIKIKPKQKIDNIQSLKNSIGSIHIGQIGGPGGNSSATYVHSHLLIGNNIYTPPGYDSLRGDLSFPEIFCKTFQKKINPINYINNQSK